MALPNPALNQIPDSYKYGWNDPEATSLNIAQRGLSAEIVAEISRFKGEPEWMTKLRLKAYRHFEARPMPNWGADLSGIDFQDIFYYIAPTNKAVQSWDDVPDYIRRTYDKLGIPEAEKKYLAGVGGQYDSEVVYHNIREDLEKQGVIFLGTDEALKTHPEMFREYFGTVIPANDNKLAALNTAVWSGGSLHLRAEGRPRRAAAAGLLPDQHREHGPVRADADHRRRGLQRSLRRGLHRPDVLDRQPAQRGGRDHRQEGRAGALHDDPELEPQRLQPRHQAGRRLRGLGDGVGRRQPRLQGHDEVPVHLPAG